MKNTLKQLKKILAAALAVLFLFLTTACGAADSGTSGSKLSWRDRQYVKTALNEIEQEWEQLYNESAKPFDDRTVNIINTRIIKIKKNDNDFFSDVAAVVKFDLFTNYFRCAPCYICTDYHDTVVFYKNGKHEARDIFTKYRVETYKTDYADVIDEVIELGTAFNTQTEFPTPDAEQEGYVRDAIREIRSEWKEELAESTIKNDGTLRIINTRLFLINPDTTYEHYEKYYSGVHAIVEFELYSDYYGSAPYYADIGMWNMVFIMEDGAVQPADLTFRAVMGATYLYDFGDLFSETVDFGPAFNETFSLR